MYDVIITAAGVGSRTNLAYNKIFLELNNKPCILYSIEAFLQDSDVNNIYITLRPSDEARMQEIINEYGLNQAPIFFVYGGKTRQESVYAALKLIRAECVMIHDAARPFVPIEYFGKLKKKLVFDNAVILGIRATDTVKEVTATEELNRTISRTKLVQAQTPQCFDTELIRKCHEKAKADDFETTDDAQLVEVYGGEDRVQVVWSHRMNFKITTAEDVKLAELLARTLWKERRTV